MIEESVLENERKGNFTRVYPSEQHTQTYRNFFEEERRNDNVLHNYVFNQKYKNMPVDVLSCDPKPGSSSTYENIKRGQYQNRASATNSRSIKPLASHSEAISQVHTTRRQTEPEMEPKFSKSTSGGASGGNSNLLS